VQLRLRQYRTQLTSSFLAGRRSDRPHSCRRVLFEGIWRVVWSPDDRLLASVMIDGWISLWDATQGLQLAHIGNGADDSRVAFSPDGKVLAFPGKRAEVKLWSVATGTEIRSFGYLG
jgi:WD40 repeat protein